MDASFYSAISFFDLFAKHAQPESLNEAGISGIGYVADTGIQREC